MQATRTGGASTNGRARLFSASEAKRILTLVPGEPSGVKVTLAHVEFDLVPVTAEELISVLDLITTFSTMVAGLQNKTLTDTEIFAAIGDDGGRIMTLMRSILYRSARLDNNAHVAELIAEADELRASGEDIPDDYNPRATFEKWFNNLPVIEALKTLAPAVLEANGIGKIQRPTAAAETEPPSTPSTPSAS